MALVGTDYLTVGTPGTSEPVGARGGNRNSEFRKIQAANRPRFVLSASFRSVCSDVDYVQADLMYLNNLHSEVALMTKNETKKRVPKREFRSRGLSPWWGGGRAQPKKQEG